MNFLTFSDTFADETVNINEPFHKNIRVPYMLSKGINIKAYFAGASVNF
jgi:hypothetical protein